MKLGIVGLSRCGKDEAASFLASITGLRYTAGTSWWARHLVFKSWQKFNDDTGGCPPIYLDADECWRDRHSYRGYWARVIGKYNEGDPIRLYRDCLAEQHFLTGVRWLHEYRACREANLCDAWLYIDRPGCVDPTCEITAADCDFTIHNHGTLEEFHDKLRRFASILRLPPKEKPQTELNPLRLRKDEFGMYCWHAGNVDLMSGSPPASTP